MTHVMVLGSGKIANTIALWLSKYDDYQITLGDQNPGGSFIQDAHEKFNIVALDIINEAILNDYVKKQKVDAIISCLAYQYNKAIASMCLLHGIHYFDVTRDVDTAEHISKLAKGKNVAFVPQCGLAPGFANIAAYSLINDFDRVDSVKIRVGALPKAMDHEHSFSLSAPSDGLVNAYIKDCRQIVDGKAIVVKPLEGIEQININGIEYEAFNSSGGIGSLYELLKGKVSHADFKSLRYPGYCANIKKLLKSLDSEADFQAVDELISESLPAPIDDVVIIHIDVTGIKEGKPHHEVFTKEYKNAPLFSLQKGAVELTIAASVCAVVDTVLNNPSAYQGYVAHQDIALKTLIENRFGNYFSQ